MIISAKDMHYKTLNEAVNAAPDKEVTVEDCCGQRYIAAGMSDKTIAIHGTPGNALCAYLNGADVTVYGNTQEAMGDTMNSGTITVYGSSGDATGYGMRGGEIYVKENVGYRAGIHMKAYKDKLPVLVVGGSAGSFLGEYQAGGLIIVLGKGVSDKVPVGYYCGTGIHGGKIFIRSAVAPKATPQINVDVATEEDMAQIKPYIQNYCEKFGENEADFYASKTFYVLTPNTSSPYKQLYTAN